MFLMIFLVSSISFGSDVNEIVKKTHLNSYYQGNDGKAQLLMKVYRKGAAKPIKKLFYMLRLDLADGGEQMFFTYFVKPADIKRTTFLVHKKVAADDYRRLYIPASDKVVAIAGSRKQDPFMGSDFTYEDVSGRHYNKDNHKLLGTEKFDGQDVYVTLSTPKVKESKIKSIKAWIHQKDLIPLKVEYTNHENQVYRRYTSLKVKDIGGYKTIIKRKMESLLEGSYTEMLINPKKTMYDIGLKSDVFSERSLKNPPIKLLK
jgi:hypothetical protein